MKSIKVNFLYNAIYQVLIILLPLVTTPYVARVLGADGTGTYSYTYTVANYFMLFAMLGVKNYGNRSIAEVRDDRAMMSRTFWEIYGLQFLCSILVLCCYFLYIYHFKSDYLFLGCIQGLYVLSGMLDISWFFFGIEEFKITVTRNICIRLSSLLLIFLFVHTKDDLWKYTLIMAAGTVVSQAYLWIYLRKLIGWFRPSFFQIWNHMKPEIILFIPVIAVSLYKMMDKLMLGQMCSMTQVGYYEYAEKIQNIPLGIITALGTVMLPRMSNLAAKGKVKESREYIANSMMFAVFMASGMLFGIAGIADDFIPLFLGPGYQECVLLLQVMSPTILFIAWANVIRTQYLIPNHMDRSYIISVVMGAIVNLIVNAWLIPRYAAMGAVIGTICAEGTVCILQTMMIWNRLSMVDYLKNTAPFLVFGAGMFWIIINVRALSNHLPVRLALEIGIGMLFYLLVSGCYYSIYRKWFKKN